MSGRTAAVLGRFPAHLDAARPGKQLGAVADAVSSLLDHLAAEMASVRRAHRLGHADTPRDLALIAALHAIGSDDLGMLGARAAAVAAAAAALEKAIGQAPARDQAAEALLDLFGVEGEPPRLPLFVASGSSDLDDAARRLAAAARAAFTSTAVLESTRTRVRTICALHAAGNGTVLALLSAAANALDLDLDLGLNAEVLQVLNAAPPPAPGGDTAPAHRDLGDGIFHSGDLFWHASYVRDRMPLERTVPTTPPAKGVAVRGPVIGVDLARQLGITDGALLASLATLGIPVTRADATLTVAQAEAVSGAFGFTLELVGAGTITIEGRATVGQLAARLSLPVPTLIARLQQDGVDVTGVNADSPLGPVEAAQAARKYGFTITEILSNGIDEAIIGMEENPLRRETQDEGGVHHAELFTLLRRGFGRELLQVQVTGEGARTVRPRLVNRDEGRGVAFAGLVPDGAVLTFAEDGHVTLATSAGGVGTDVTSFAFSWSGGCFADADAPHARDFTFAGTTAGPPAPSVATFAVGNPAGALDRDATFPHAGTLLDVPGVGVGETRFAFFVQEASYSSREGTLDAPVVRRPAPGTVVGLFDASVFAPDLEAAADPSRPWLLPRPESAKLALSWMEHEAYAVRLLIPPRFFGVGGTPDPATRVRAALERFRPAGVTVRVEAIDDHWVLGGGIVSTAADEDPILLLRGGTALWPAPSGGGT